MANIYLNGAFVPLSQARVPVMDRGFLFGDGIYEVIPTYGGRPVRWIAHMERLERSLAGIRLAPPLTREAWSDLCARLLAQQPGLDQALYLQVTRGAPPTRDHRFPSDDTPPTVMALAKPISPRPATLAEQGVAVLVREELRWGRCDLKTTSLVAAVLFAQEASEQGAEETLLVRDGWMIEGATSNLFAVIDGVIVTPPLGHALLAGITRALVIDLAQAAGLRVEERPISRATLDQADEVWISSATREIMPVTRVEQQTIGSGCPGPIWRLLDATYQDYKNQLTAL